MPAVPVSKERQYPSGRPGHYSCISVSKKFWEARSKLSNFEGEALVRSSRLVTMSARAKKLLVETKTAMIPHGGQGRGNGQAAWEKVKI